MSWGRSLRDLSPRAILVLGFALFLVYAFPGYMSTDSVQQLTEARSGHFSDGNPPLMAAQWWLLDRIVSGPILMLLLQGCLFLGGVYVLLQRVLRPRGAAWAAIGILLFPPVLATMAVIWKDAQMAAYLVVGIAAIIQPRLRTRLIGIGLLVAACSIRHNALAAVVPLVAILFEWRRRDAAVEAARDRRGRRGVDGRRDDRRHARARQQASPAHARVHRCRGDDRVHARSQRRRSPARAATARRS